jgi:hypothetical protein
MLPLTTVFNMTLDF